MMWSRCSHTEKVLEGEKGMNDMFSHSKDRTTKGVDADFLECFHGGTNPFMKVDPSPKVSPLNATTAGTHKS